MSDIAALVSLKKLNATITTRPCGLYYGKDFVLNTVLS